MATKVGGVRIDKTKLENLIRVSPQKAVDFIDALAFDGEGYAKRSMGMSPSAPGDAPGVVTGALRSSIHVENAGKYKRQIVAGTDYAIHLEYGTSKMAARPFFGPMIMYLQRNVSRHWGVFVE